MNTIYDKLIDWANNKGYWAQVLLDLCFKNNKITSDNLDEIVLCYEKANCPNITFEKKDEPSMTKSFLLSIKNVKNVNLLLNDQELKFNKNLTVIYGSNGSGKTGYVRILKSMGDSLDSNCLIYTNLIDKDLSEQTASVSFLNGNDEKTFVWNSRTPISLNLKIFNSNCVKFSLDSKKNILFMPKDFNYFNIINVATVELSKKAKIRLEQLHAELQQYEIYDGTEVSSLLSSILEKGNVCDIDSFIKSKKYDLESVAKVINELNKKSDLLNPIVISTQIGNIEKVRNKLNELNVFLFISSGLYNKSFWDDYKNDLIELNELIKKNVKVEDFVKNLELEEEQQVLFRDFLLAADRFLKSKSGMNFESEEKCIFCGQPIDKDAKELLASYSRFVTNDNGSIINKKIKKIETHRAKMQEALVKLEQFESFFSDEDPDFCSKISILAQNIATIMRFNYDPLPNFDGYDTLCDFATFKNDFDATLDKYNTLSKTLKGNKDNIEKEIANNRLQLNELKSVATLLGNVNSISNNLNSIKNVLPLSKITNSSLSAIQSSILTNNFKDNYLKVLNEQLHKFRAPKNLNFSPMIVSSKLMLKQSFLDGDYDMYSIMSEGEQKVVALSHFVAENLLEDKDNVLVFDDPVNSLDLQRMENVAENLVKLSIEKQVIIFTHNLVFVGMVDDKAKKVLKDDERCYICVERAFIDDKQYTGLVKYELPNLESYSYYKTLLNIIATNEKELREDSKNIHVAFSYMRSALELMVEDKVFKKTVKRYEPNIKMSCFETINTEAIKEHAARISNLHNKICRYIEGHSSSPHSKNDPTLEDFRECYEEFKDLDEIFKK